MSTSRTRATQSRRALLTGAGAAGITTAAGISTAAGFSTASGALRCLGLLASAATGLGASSSAQAMSDDYRALVCVFLYGGSDSVNMYVPTTVNGYADYENARRRLRVARGDLLETDSALGFNPDLPRCHALFENRSLGVVRNVGNLIAPLDRASFLNESPLVPVGLFAHDYQQEQWQKGYPSRAASLVDSGWGGRIADRLARRNAPGNLSPNITLAGNNFWIGGEQRTPVSVHPVRGLRRLSYLDSESSSSNSAREATLDAILESTGSHPMKQQVAMDFRRAKATSRVVAEALGRSPAFSSPVTGGNSLAAQLRMVARLIASRGQLGSARQVFFVGLGGWDTHGDQATRLPVLLRSLDIALGTFSDDLAELGLSDQVTTFTASDFGRSLTTNGDGTDHGWGGHYMVMGGAVAGGQLYGQMPDYALGGDDDAGDDGRIIPTTSVSQYGAVMARWLGLDQVALDAVFPDLKRFGANWDAGLEFV